MPEIDLDLPTWRQVVLGLWLLATVALFLRQVLVAYAAALGA